MPEDQRLPAPEALSTLTTGEVEIEGRMPWSSNATFLVSVTLDGVSINAIYKPHRGERPLWDFPDGLYQREVAAYELSRALGWGLVPETIVREDAPLDTGSLQRFVEADFEQHYFTILEDADNHAALRAMAAFDLVANNADRKGGHCLIDSEGHLWGIDHGLCFHREPKLRTVIWDFGGEEVPPALIEDLARLAACPDPALAGLLDAAECAAISARAAAVVRRGVFPAPDHGRPYPWPLV